MRPRIYSTDTDAGQLTVVDRLEDGRFERVCEIPIGNAPRGSLKTTADGRGYVSNCGGDTISEIDLHTNREVARIKVGLAPRGIGILPGERFALVSNSGSNSVSIVDLSTRDEVGRVSVGRDPRHMAITPDGRAAYVCIWGSHYVAKLETRHLLEADCDPDGISEVRKISVGSGAHPYSAAISPDGRLLFVANTQAPYVTVVDCATDQVVREVDMGHKGARAVAFSEDGKTALVSVEDTSEVVAVAVDTLEVTNRWPVGPGPRGIARDLGGDTFYASAFARSGSGAHFTANTLTVLDLREALRSAKAKPGVREIPVGTGPCSVSVFDVDTLGRLEVPRQAAAR